MGLDGASVISVVLVLRIPGSLDSMGWDVAVEMVEAAEWKGVNWML